MDIRTLFPDDPQSWELPGILEVPIDPYMNSTFMGNAFGLNPSRAFLVSDHESQSALYLSREDCPKFPWFFHKLRTIDWSAIRLPAPLSDDPERAVIRLLDSSSRLSKKTRSGFLTLYKLDQTYKELYEHQLKTRNIPHEIIAFNTRWMIRLEDSPDAYESLRSRKSRYNLRRSRRLLSEHLGAPVGYRRLRSQDTDEKRFMEHADTTLTMLRRLHADDSAQVERLRRFYPEVIRYWYKKQLVEICELHCNDQIIASELNLLHNGILYVVLMSFDSACYEFSPSMLLLKDQIADTYSRGIRTIDLGGEGDEWKQVWSNYQESTWMVKFPIHRLTRLLWSVYRRITARHPAVPACRED
jgi:hypothetical protein